MNTYILDKKIDLFAILDGIPDIIGIQKPDLTMVRYNKTGYETLGLSHSDVAGKTCYSLIGRDAPCEVCPTLQALKSRRPESVERYMPELNRYYLCRSHPILDGNGEVLLVVEQFQDITELKQREKEYLDLINGMNDAAFVIGFDGNFLAVNETAVRVLGYSRKEFLRMGPADIDGFLSREKIQLLAKGMKKDTRQVFETQHRTKDGRQISVEISSSLVSYRGSPAILSVARDITQRKRTEQESEKLQAQLIQAQKMESIGRLAGGVAHDFNNMLTVIMGHTDFALANLDESHPLYSQLREIRTAAGRSSDLTSRLLAFARKQPIAPRVMDLNETLEGMLKMLQRLIGEDITLSWLPGEKLWPVKMDSSQIDQILANLCSNARDAIRDVGEITIETHNVTLGEHFCADRAELVPGDYVLLEVSDDGCGMDKEILSHVFEPFFTTKEVGKGTGLGLSTIYGIVKQNQGFIYVYSEKGKGTSVKIYLPRHFEKVEAAQERPEGESVTPRHETVLLVEDEPMVLKMGKVMLERLGYHVLPAGSPAQAMELGREHKEKIHLLMTDMVMPEMNGRQLAAELREIHPGIKNLFMSGYTANVIAQSGVLGEGTHFIQKPFSIHDLALKIREALQD
jgi:PAS domain S-box-containing protein